MLEVLNHPLITHKLTQMRMKETTTKDFRELLDEIAELMAYEVCRDLPVRPIDIETPSHVAVENVHISESLHSLAYHMSRATDERK